MIAVNDNTVIKSNRPIESERLFKSDVIEKKIKEVTKLLRKNPYLAWMFQNCYPNTHLIPLYTSMVKMTPLFTLEIFPQCG